MAPRWRTPAAIALSLAAVFSACRSGTQGSDEPRTTLAFGSPLSPADPLDASSRATAAAAGICTANAPIICDHGCCPAQTGCDDAGLAADAGLDAGCIGEAQSGACPADAPLECPAIPADCTHGCSSMDESPNGNRAYLSPPAHFVEGKFGTGVTMGDTCVTTGSTTHCSTDISLGVHGFPTSALTLEVWVLPSGGGEILDYSVSTLSGSEYFVLNWGSTGPLLESQDKSCAGPPIPPGFAAGAWHFVAATLDTVASKMTVYLDGVAGTPCSGGTMPRWRQPMTIAGYSSPVSVDEVRALDFADDGGLIARDFDAGPLRPIPGTVGLWHFDEGTIERCCPPGGHCGADGGCVGGDAGSPAGCPASAPVDCGNTTCCPAGDTCAGGGCAVPANLVDCPSGAPVLCADGTCCPSGYTCADGGCVLSVPLAPPSPACAPGYAVAAPNACCPSNAWYESYDNICPENGNAACSPSDCSGPFTCATCGTGAGFACCLAAPETPSCTPCAGGCCDTDGGETCAGSGCCPADKPACGGSCCDPASCDAGVCNLPTAPASCPNGEALCADHCCPDGTSCETSSGLCIAGVPPVGHVCPEGVPCGETCCGDGWVCASPDNCVWPPVISHCTPEFPNECGLGGPCCAPGCVCMGSGGGHQQATTCVCTGTERGGPQGPRCDGGGFCDVGQLCSGDGCCDAEHPVSCGSSCCLPGAPCTDGVCGCPQGRVDCGSLCCGAGATCTNGECRATCPADLPNVCGDHCCADGVTPGGSHADGGAPFTCPNGGVACGSDCCLPGAPCTNGNCGCPLDSAVCGDTCCAPGEVCNGGLCGQPSSSSGGGGDCSSFGEQYCLPPTGGACYNGHCQCCWALLSGSTATCYGCNAACAQRGYVCVNGVCIQPPSQADGTPQGPACN